MAKLCNFLKKSIEKTFVDTFYTQQKVSLYEKYRSLPFKKEVLLNIREKMDEWIAELDK